MQKLGVRDDHVHQNSQSCNFVNILLFDYNQCQDNETAIAANFSTLHSRLSGQILCPPTFCVLSDKGTIIHSLRTNTL